MKPESIKVIILEPSKPVRVEVIKNELNVLQALVGGYIECVRQEGFDIIINEEGKLMDLEPNFVLPNGDYIAGTAIFAGVNYDEGEFISLPDEHIKFISSLFKRRK